MQKDMKVERLRWILPIHKKEEKMVGKTGVCPCSQRSLERWLSLFRKYGKEGLIPKSTRKSCQDNFFYILILFLTHYPMPHSDLLTLPSLC